MASLVLPVLFTPILTILSLSRTAHLGAANSTRAGCILPAEATKNTRNFRTESRNFETDRDIILTKLYLPDWLLKLERHFYEIVHNVYVY